MTEEQLKAFLSKVQADTSIKERIEAAINADAIVEIAKELGFSISTESLKDCAEQVKSQSSLSEEELENVSGAGCWGLSNCPRLTGMDDGKRNYHHCGFLTF